MLLTKRNLITNNQGVTLIEVIIVLVIVAIVAAIAGYSLKPAIARRQALDCGSKMITTIQQIRSQAQSVGRRTVFQLTANAKAQDIDGDGNAEYFIGFIDLDSDATLDAGETVFVRGTAGDQLCSSQVSIDQAATTTNTIAFEPLGFLLGGAANKDIYLKASTTDIHVQVISLTGMMRSFIKKPPGAPAPQWEELK